MKREWKGIARANEEALNFEVDPRHTDEISFAVVSVARYNSDILEISEVKFNSNKPYSV